MRSGPRRTCLNMSKGGVPDMTENITFDTPLTGGKNMNQGSIEFYLRITGCEFAV